MKEIISNRQGTAIITMFIMGSTLVMGVGSDAKQDIWLAILISIAMAVPVCIIYARLLSAFHGKDLFDILQELFGKFIGKVISLLFIWYAFHLGSLVIRNFSEFIKVVSMPETPDFVIVIFMGSICIWAVKEGIEVLGRMASLLLPPLVVIIIVVFFLSLTQVKLENLRPVLYQGMQPVVSSAFSAFSFPFAETVVFLMAFHSLKNKSSPYKVYFFGLLIGGLVVFNVSVRNVLVLGPAMVSTLFFPAYSAVSMIKIGTFIQRIEIAVSVVFLSAGFIKISVCLYAASSGLAKVLNLGNYQRLVVPVGLLMMNQSTYIYKNTMEMSEWAFKIYKYYALPFQIILPLLIWIAAEIKIRRRGAKNSTTNAG